MALKRAPEQALGEMSAVSDYRPILGDRGVHTTHYLLLTTYYYLLVDACYCLLYLLPTTYIHHLLPTTYTTYYLLS